MGMHDGVRFCDACGASAGPGERLIPSSGAWFCTKCAAMAAQCSATAEPATARTREEVAAAVPPPAVVISKKIYWTGIVALVLGLAAGLGVAWLVDSTDRSVRASLARSTIENRALLRESARFTGGPGAPARGTEIGEEARRRADEIGYILYTREVMTRDLWGRAALPMAILGGLGICPIMLILAIMTRKAPIGLGKTALIFFLSVAGSFGAFSGLADYGVQQMHQIVTQNIVEAENNS